MQISNDEKPVTSAGIQSLSSSGVPFLIFFH
jgi:hypothetical protein